MYLSCAYNLLWSVQPSLLLSLTPSLPLPIIEQLSIHIVTSSTHTDVMHFNIVDYLLFFFSFPSSPLLQTYSTYKCVSDHVWFCVHVYILYLSSTYERKHLSFVFLSLAFFT
jgi:hypothetical protein